MLKVLILAFFASLSMHTHAFSKRKLNYLIESIKIVQTQKQIIAGSNFSVHLNSILNSGVVFNSKSKSKIGFRDFKVKIGCSTEILKWRKGELTLGPRYKALEASNKEVQLEMMKRSDISGFPIHFSDIHVVEVNGQHGKNRKHRNTKRCGFDGCNGRSGTDGERGKDLDVYVSIAEFPRENARLVKVEVIHVGGKKQMYYTGLTGSIIIFSEGGFGGAGGHAGKGKNGSQGCSYPDLESDCSIDDRENYGGDGGDGQNGGLGGNGGDGGNGGRGGNINLYFKSDALFFKDQIVVRNNGGAGGNLGVAGFGGSGGVGGIGTRGPVYWGEDGENGDNGENGENGIIGTKGKPGEINYYKWKALPIVWPCAFRN